MLKLLKKIWYFIAFILILAFYLSYSSISNSILKKIGINIKDMPLYEKTIILLLIEFLFLAFLCFIYKKDLKKEFKIYKDNFESIFPISLKYWIIGLIVMSVSNIVLHYAFHTSANNENEVQKLLAAMPVYVAIASGICAPIIEELIFRKALKKCFYSNYLFILASGFIFGLLHVILSTNIYEFLYIIPYGFFGGVFAYIYCKTKTIFSTIVIHMIHNTILVIIALTSLGVI